MIYLVRHGRTEFNAEGRFQGRLDSPLTPLGIEQAGRYGELLKGLIGDATDWTLISSPLGRAVHTAEIIAGALGLDLNFPRDPRLAEIGMGLWDGLTIEDIDVVSPGVLSNTTRYDFFFHAPDGERYDAFAGRLGDWLSEAMADAKPRIAVSHGVAGRVLRGLYARMDREAALKLDSPQDAIFRLSEGQIERIDCAPISAPLAFGGQQR
jgi:broad specificity phosphatase PhoE